MSDDKRDPRFPLGTPQRPTEPDLVPVPGRPNWYRHRYGSGEPIYREPPRPNSTGGLM